MSWQCKKSWNGLTLILAITLILGGCAFGTRNTTLQYQPQSEDDTISTAQAATLPASKKAEISLGTFIDQRKDKNIVGTVRNGWGMRTADVVATNDVTEWISNAIKIELTTAGYSVVEKPLESQAILSGDITNVFCDMYLTYEGSVSLYVKLFRDGNEMLSKLYVGNGSTGVAWAGTAEAFGQSLSMALSDALKQLIADLNKMFGS